MAHAAGRHADAERACRAVLDRRPGSPEALQVLGLVALDRRDLRAAVAALTAAVRQAPRVPDFRNSLGTVLAAAGRRAEALAEFAEALRLRPGYPAALANRGRTLLAAGRPDEAAAALAQYLAARPGDRDAHEALAAARMAAGDAAGLVAARRATVAAFPADAAAASNLLYNLHYLPGPTPRELYDAHRSWAARYAPPDPGPVVHHHGSRDPSRRLRIGYVSAGFCDHPVARFQEAALRHADRDRFEVVCYSDAAAADAVTHRFRGLADEWRETRGLTHEQLAERVRADRIDVLVDLHGHAPGNRLLAFARRPAPVQVTYNGYVDTTGVPAVGWRVTDALHDPPGPEVDGLHTERLWRLPGGNWCYTPDPDGPPVATPRGGDGGAGFTFGSLNVLAKASGPCLRAWARVLAAVPGSRLMLAFQGDPIAGGGPVLARLAAAGLPPERVTLVGRVPSRRAYLERYAEIDLCLDPFPFNGITTTCDAMWMGVPVVALAGATHVSRAGVSLLRTVGLPELVADDEAEYVQVAAGLASDPARLAAVRQGLRERMRASPLCDGPRLAREVEAAYRAIWADWCRWA